MYFIVFKLSYIMYYVYEVKNMLSRIPAGYLINTLIKLKVYSLKLKHVKKKKKWDKEEISKNGAEIGKKT